MKAWPGRSGATTVKWSASFGMTSRQEWVEAPVPCRSRMTGPCPMTCTCQTHARGVDETAGVAVRPVGAVARPVEIGDHARSRLPSWRSRRSARCGWHRHGEAADRLRPCASPVAGRRRSAWRRCRSSWRGTPERAAPLPLPRHRAAPAARSAVPSRAMLAAPVGEKHEQRRAAAAPHLVGDEGSLIDGRTERRSAAAGKIGEASAGALQRAGRAAEALRPCLPRKAMRAMRSRRT